MEVLEKDPIELVRSQLGQLQDETVWGSKDPGWHYHFETGIYLETAAGKLHLRSDDGEWEEVADAKPSRKPAPPSHGRAGRGQMGACKEPSRGGRPHGSEVRHRQFQLETHPR